MKNRFAFALLALGAAGISGCAHRESAPETAATPTYRPEDLLEATASVGHHGLEDRVALLETQVKVLKVELGRVSGATERLEAHQIATLGVMPEPASKVASTLDKPLKHGKAAKPKAPEEKAAAPADPRDPWAAPAPQAQSPEAQSPQASAAPAEPAKPAAVAASAPAAQKVASAEPAAAPTPATSQTAASTPASSGPAYAVQLGAYGSAERAATGWDALKSKGGDLLAGLQPKREEFSTGGKTVYRLKAGPLPDIAAAKSRCDALKGKDISCLVTVFSGDWPSS